MKYLSVCSGIEAATVAWHPLGWEPVAFSEIEKFPSQVLAHHYPDTPNWGDMTKFKEWKDADVNVFVGGTPCQSFSVAGLRKGLDDPRGNLMLTYLAIAAKYRPQWLVWENVPGVLSSNGGLDFASLLRGMGELGYGFAYRILDAQYFGVAQRRRRVFVVGYLGNWRPAAAVLFERHSLCGHSAPSREKRKETSSPTGASLDVSCIGTLTAGFGKVGAPEVDAYTCIPAAKTFVGLQDCNHFSTEISGMIVTREGVVADTAHMVMQPIPIDSMNHISRPDHHSMGDFEPGASMYTLTKQHHHAVAQPIAFSRNDDGRDATNDLAPTMRVAGNAGGMLAAAIATHDVAGTMLSRKTSGGFSNSIDHAAAGYMALQPKNPMAVVAPTLTAANDPSRSPQSSEVTQQVYSVLQASMAVRRLTPVECERLQGFPDNYTDIKHKGKPTPDGPRYKALGNSMAVPVMHWIGQRIQEVQDILDTRETT